MGTLHDVARTLNAARDEQLARVVAVVDALPARGAADALIAPLRPRLAALRPTRPLNLTRLLFTPLDPLIVPTAQWRRGMLAVPRAALAPLAAVVDAAVGPTMRAVAGELCGIVAGDANSLGRLGSVAWPAAAFALTKRAAPPGWYDATGVAVSDYGEIAAAVRTVLSQAVALWRLRTVPKRDEAGLLGTILADAAVHGPHGLGCVLRILLTCHPSASRVLSAAVHGGVATDDAVDAVLADGLGGCTADAQVKPAVLARTASLLAAAEAAATHKDRRDALQSLRVRADIVEVERFAGIMQGDLIGPARRLGATQSDEEIAYLEEAARNLRRLEIAGRPLGNGRHYDSQLRDGAATLGGMANLGLVDRVRLVEILVGPDQAAELLRTGR